MIVVRCKGGLGNQCFQYAAGRALAARQAVPLRFDSRWFARPEHQVTVTRTFDLPAFAVACETATDAELAPFAFEETRRLWPRLKARSVRLFTGRRVWSDGELGYNPEFAALGINVLLDGYFQHPAYFASVENELRRELRLREAPPDTIVAKASELRAAQGVCIQVRRTDFVLDRARAQRHGVCSLDYFRAAWTLVRARAPNVRGFVFADDPAWAVEAFQGWPDVSVMTADWNGPNFLHQFFLMQACRHFIIANSTWGWWAAWLGAQPNSVVVMPARWFADPTVNATAMGLRLPHWHVC